MDCRDVKNGLREPRAGMRPLDKQNCPLYIIQHFLYAQIIWLGALIYRTINAARGAGCRMRAQVFISERPEAHFALKGTQSKRSVTRVRNNRLDVKKHAPGLKCCYFSLESGSRGGK